MLIAGPGRRGSAGGGLCGAQSWARRGLAATGAAQSFVVRTHTSPHSYAGQRPPFLPS